ncbi:hypothetical protein D918_01722 [Trichuris suis]|nr:hypothetical protein D918_01722 [Trichuris suis]
MPPSGGDDGHLPHSAVGTLRLQFEATTTTKGAKQIESHCQRATNSSVNCRQSTSSKGQQKEDKRKSTSVQSTPATTTTTTTGSSGFKNGTNSLNDSVFDLDSSSPCAKSSESLACRFHLPSWKRCFTKKGSSSCNCDSTPQNERHSSHHAIGGEQGRSSNNDAEKAAQGTTTTTTSLCACNSDACSVNCPLGRSPFMVNNDGFTGTGNRKTSFKITSVREKTGSESEDDDSANSDGEHCVVAPWSVNGVPSSQKVTPTGGRPSRFHIVTVSGRPYKRDRWLCQDIEPIPEEGNGNGQVSAAAGSNTPRRKFAITKVPEAVIQSSFSTSTVMSKPLPNKYDRLCFGDVLPGKSSLQRRVFVNFGKILHNDITKSAC